MPHLAPGDVVGIWEAGSGRPEWGRALAALAPMFPDSSVERLAALTLGERNAHLLALRRDVIGPVMQAVVKCPQCGEPLEFEQRIDELLEDYAAPVVRECAIEDAGHAARYRLLTSDDLAGVQGLDGEDAVRDALITRAILDVRRDGAPIALAEVPDTVIARIADDMGTRDPLATVAIPLACAACDHVWPAVLEIVSFLWAEIDRQARLVLADVVRIAQAYGWSEREIMAMSPARRNFYIDAIG